MPSDNFHARLPEARSNGFFNGNCHFRDFWKTAGLIHCELLSVSIIWIGKAICLVFRNTSFFLSGYKVQISTLLFHFVEVWGLLTSTLSFQVKVFFNCV
jgi:hypothetical protein